MQVLVLILFAALILVARVYIYKGHKSSVSKEKTYKEKERCNQS